MQDSFLVFLPFSFVAAMLLAGVVLRRYVPFFQKFLVPSSIIGGLLGFVLINSFDIGLKPEMFTMITFQFFNLSFISLGLTGVDGEKNSSKVVLRGSLWMFILTTLLLCGQGAVGFGVWELVDLITGSESAAGYGLLLAHGFTQGPGQALAVGGVWQNNFNIPDALGIALTFSAIGFLVASFVGVPLAMWGLKKGAATYQSEDRNEHYYVGIKPVGERESCGSDTVFSGNLDTFSLHLALIAVTYAINYGLCLILTKIFAGTVIGDMIFGLFFVWGMFTAMGVRKVLDFCKASVVLDNNVQRHFTGIFVDFLITGTLCSIAISIVIKYFAQLAVVCLVGTLFTLFVSVYFGRRLNEYGLERLLVIFGSGTGTIPSGLALLRIVDQEFQTSAAFESGAQQLLLSVTCTLVMGMVAGYPGTGLAAWHVAFIELGIAVACVLALKVLKLWQKPVF